MSSQPDPRLDTGRRLVEQVLNPMKRTFVGKDEIIDLLGVCLVANENLFLLGPPGTAKSALVSELCRLVEGRSFEYLLTRFTEPNELFGPFDIARLRQGELVTNTEGMLPEASLAFLDELLNANSAILNSLLTVLNERMFRRGRERIDVPVMMVAGASNHLPEDEALQALFDRFLLRVRCDAVPDDDLGKVLDAGWALDAREQAASGLTVEDVRALSTLVPSVDLAAVREPFVQLVLRLRQAGIRISDRRAVKLQRLMAASALLCGRMRAEVSDQWICRFIWEAEEEIETLDRIVSEALKDADPATAHPMARRERRVDPDRLLEEIDRAATEMDGADRDERLATMAADCQWVANEEERLFLQERINRAWQRD